MKKIPLHSRGGMGVGHPIQPLQFGGAGFIPDLSTEHGLQTLHEANKTSLEDGPLGCEGMLPAPGFTGRPLQPGYPEGGTGGAGSFNCRQAAPPQLL